MVGQWVSGWWRFIGGNPSEREEGAGVERRGRRRRKRRRRKRRKVYSKLTQ